MTPQEQQLIKRLLVSVLSDEYGVSEKTFELINSLCKKIGMHIDRDINATDGRFYIE